MSIETSNALRLEGNKFFQEKKFYNALRCYTEAIENNPNDALSIANRSQTLLNLGSYDLAYIDAENAVKMDPNNTKAHFRLVTSLHKMGLDLFAKEASKKFNIDWSLVVGKNYEEKINDNEYIEVNHTLKLEDTQSEDSLEIIRF
uniref:TPR_REGION domain-containing protein n=1 Tax=Parastrongyloides trichosuri TaxID=131310 RepID=A0A0N4ZY12_PARTI